MTSRMVAWRHIACLVLSLPVGMFGVSAWPLSAENPFLAMVASESPRMWQAWSYGYTALWFTTPFLALSVLSSLAYIFLVSVRSSEAFRSLPPYPPVAERSELFLVLGEQHHARTPRRATAPTWLTIPERGLYTGIAIVGAIGTGKTSGCMYPYAQQLLTYRADDEEEKIAGLVLEVKGDFCHQVRRMLARCGRADDYVEVGLDSGTCYNPLHNDLEAYALAYGIASLLTNLYGRGKEPFWQQAYTNLLKFVILLYKTLDDYVTLFQVYGACINPDVLRARIDEGVLRFSGDKREVHIAAADYIAEPGLREWGFESGSDGRMAVPWSDLLVEHLHARSIAFSLESPLRTADESLKAEQFDAVKRWFEHDWSRIEPKLRTSIVEGISVFLSLFDDNPAVKRAFCPPKACYDPIANADGRYGRPLPPIGELIEQGKVICLNFPIAANPGLARTLGVLLKQDFQRAMLTRIPRISADPDRPWRQVLFLCDEYQSFATVGEADPSGDEKFFALSRQSRCIPIVATQSLSSLRSTLSGESWRTLLQSFRTKIFLALSDDFSAHVASELCGKVERLKPSYALTEAGQQARVSLFTGRAASPTSTLTAAKTYSTSLDYVFQPKVFAELQNAQAIVLPYDGLNPMPPTYCYLKPHWLDPQVSYFDHLAEGCL